MSLGSDAERLMVRRSVVDRSSTGALACSTSRRCWLMLSLRVATYCRRATETDTHQPLTSSSTIQLICRAGLALQRALAPSDQALVRFNLDEHVWPVRRAVQ